MSSRYIRDASDASDYSRYTDRELHDSYRLLAEQKQANCDGAPGNGLLAAAHVIDQDEIARELQQRGAL
ncbi:hypothetical protein [Streptomyces sp. NPDC045470]|uniref:hypothetical protein n=1 Tax=Streptomyces sp. NPDC045470 TaxID=3155469 RepID=UPI0033E8BE1C